MHSVQDYVCAVDLQSSQTQNQTPSIGLQPPVPNHYHSWLRHRSYSSTNKTKIVWISLKLFFNPGWMHLMFMCKKPPVGMKIWISRFLILYDAVILIHKCWLFINILKEFWRRLYFFTYMIHITDNKIFSTKSRKNKHYVIKSGGP